MIYNFSMEAITPQKSISLEIIPCKTIDDFIENYDLNGTYRRHGVKSRNAHITITRPTTFSEAQAIVAIYQEIYHGTYPYKEMLDAEYVFHTFTDPTYYWKIFTTTDPTTSDSILVGCFTIVVDETHKRAYMRGLNILPSYQGKVNVRELSYGMIKRFFADHKEVVYSWYNESRTEHSIVQYLSHNIGAMPYAFFGGKDYFNGEKESDMLMVAHTQEALHSLRHPPEKIHHNLMGLYFRIAYLHQFEQIPKCESQMVLDVNTLDIAIQADKCRIHIEDKGYGYSQVTFSIPDSSDYMTFLHTKSVFNIEKIEFHYENLSTMAAILEFLTQYATEEHIEYIEFTISAANTHLTEYFLQSQYRIAGYIPAWIHSKHHPNQLEDAVVFSWHAPQIAIQEPKLIPASVHLTSILHNTNQVVVRHQRHGIQNLPSAPSILKSLN